MPIERCPLSPAPNKLQNWVLWGFVTGRVLSNQVTRYRLQVYQC